MVTVQEATKIVLENSLALPDTQVPLHQATGRVLREDLVADRDFPPFDRVSMDGIAICFDAFSTGSQHRFQVAGIQAAGKPQLSLSGPSYCLEVMTGAMLPAGTDCVVRYEDLILANGIAEVAIGQVQLGQNIHRQGSDRKAGDTIVKAGQLISPAEVGVAATVGKATLRVAALPQVAVISTGDELVEVSETPLPHQIRRSNAHTLAATLSGWGIAADLLHLPDDPAAISRLLAECLEKYDALLLSGGVSMGKFDYLPTVMGSLGVQKLFHQVSQRPGKPFWFGRSVRTVVFAFPGNPVSTFMGAYRYFHPWLRASLGLQPFDYQYAALSEDFFFKPNLTYFLQVKLQKTQAGQVEAAPLAGQGSGDLANLADTDAFLELPIEQQFFAKGESFPFWQFR